AALLPVILLVAAVLSSSCPPRDHILVFPSGHSDDLLFLVHHRQQYAVDQMHASCCDPKVSAVAVTLFLLLSCCQSVWIASRPVLSKKDICNLTALSATI